MKIKSVNRSTNYFDYWFR